MLANSKMMLGAALVCLILSAPLSMLSTGAVEGAVEDNFETFPADSACANSDCSEIEEDWATSTGERSYYAWNLTNPTEVMGGADPVYEQVGPFDYDITYTREVIELNKDAGTLKYSESKVYTCAEDTRTPCDMEVTTTNIPFQPQVVGATGTAISAIMDLTKAGFAAGAINNEMTSFSAGKATADGLAATYNGIQAGAMTEGNPVDAATASAMIANGWFSNPDPAAPGWNEFFAASPDLGNGTNYTQAAGSPPANFGDMSYAFESAVMPTGDDVSLTGMVGVMVLAGHCDALPTQTNISDGVEVRAAIWGYTCLLYTSPSPRDGLLSRMTSSA